MMEELPDGDPRVERIEKTLEDLSEHFDSVRIFATVHNPDGEDQGSTHSITKGKGNWYATYGLVGEWLIRQEEQNRIAERRNSE